MKILIDTNIIIDIFLNRKGLVSASEKVLSLYIEGHELGVSLLSYTTGYYLISKENPGQKTLIYLKNLRNMVTMVPTTQKILDESLNSEFKDFEDAIQYFTALRNGYDFICTRNVKDFKNPEIYVLTPEELLIKLEK